MSAASEFDGPKGAGPIPFLKPQVLTKLRGKLRKLFLLLLLESKVLGPSRMRTLRRINNLIMTTISTRNILSPGEKR